MGNKYGINIRKWCKEHECEVEGVLNSSGNADDVAKMLDKHRKKLGWLMHERFVHLIVLLIAIIALLFSIFLLVSAPDTLPASLPMCILIFILGCFYVRHYFFLENTVQKWYMIEEELAKRSEVD